MKDVKKGMLKAKKVSVGMLVMALVMAFAFATLAPPVSAKTVPATQTRTTSYDLDFTVNYDNITIELDGGDTSTVLIGQMIQFHNSSGDPSGMVTLKKVGGKAEEEGHEQYSEDNGKLNTKPKDTLYTGKYMASCASGCNNTTIIVKEPYMDLYLKKDGKSIKRIPIGTNFTVDLSTNLDDNDGVTLEVTDPGGNTRSYNPADGTGFEDVNIAHVRDMVINTSKEEWYLGTYTFKVFTEDEGEYACGLDDESNEKKLEIVSSEIKIKAEKTEVVVSENVQLMVTGVPNHNIEVLVERGAEYATFPGGTSKNPGTKKGNFTHLIEPEGEMKYVVYFDKIGTYTVKVKDLNSGKDDSVDISVSKKKVTFTMPATCAIGADLVINGTANTGNTVDIAIENRIVKADATIDKKGKFEVKLPTPATSGTGTEGAIKIKAFIDCVFEGDDVSGVQADGSAMVLMVTGDLTAESSATLVSPGDFFTLSGTAPGSKIVDILIVAPKGGSGKGMNPTNSEDNGLPSGIVYEAASVSSDFTWSVDIDVNEDADSGTYLVFVLSPGKNGVYDGLKTGDLLNGIGTKYFGSDLSRLAGKTQEQINATIWDGTIGTAGSDDFMKKFTIKIGTAEVKLYSIADVVIGDDLVIMGTSNREGHSIIVKVKGLVNLGTELATVENGKFKATFSTSEALTGEYTVESDDGEGHTDTTTVNVITPVRAVASPTPTPTATPVPTTSQEMSAEAQAAAQLENSSTSAPSAVPGFGAVFAIAAFAVVYLFVSRKKRM
ncbi:MAG: hypothetical protein WBD09_05195 [Halobacteriota archaeon]